MRQAPVEEGPAPDETAALEEGQVLALLDHLFVRTGIDFRRYAAGSIRRRLRHVMEQDETDVDERALERVRAGVYPLDRIREYTRDYVRSGGEAAFSEYYRASADGAVLRDRLRRHLVFARHDLATDAPFNEFHVVLCRNVLIYFDGGLQERAHDRLWRSLAAGAVLALGSREAVPPYLERGRYERLDLAQRLWVRAGLR